MKQMTIDERKRIEFLTGRSWSVLKIAEELGRSPSTIRNELLKHRIDSDKHHGYSNRLYALFDERMRTMFTGFGERLARNTPKCASSRAGLPGGAVPLPEHPPESKNTLLRETRTTSRLTFRAFTFRTCVYFWTGRY